MAEDPTTEFAKELAKQIPAKEAYADAVSPAAKIAGTALEDAAKTIHLVLAPLQLTAALQDRFRRFIDRAIRTVPEERRITPAPQMLGPVLEGVRYEPEGTPIDEMFSQLLSRASDSDRVSEAHPAFPLLLRQLSADEAVVLQQLADRNVSRLRRRRTAQLDAKTNRFFDFRLVEEQFPVDTLSYPANLDFYIDHLYSLGLAGLFKHDEKPIMSEGRQTGTDITLEYRLTDFGQRFIAAAYKGREV